MFKAFHSQTYGFDEPNTAYKSLLQYYQPPNNIQGKEQLIRWKSVKIGDIDKVYAVLDSANENIKFYDGNDVEITPQKASADSIKIIAVSANIPEQIYTYTAKLVQSETKEPDTSETVVGMLNVVGYNELKKTLHIIPVNNNTIPGMSINQFADSINKIYSQAVVNWTVNMEQSIDFKYDYADSNVTFDAFPPNQVLYTPDMQALINKFKSERSFDPADYYIFLVNNPENQIEIGIMPFFDNFAFIYVDQTHSAQEFTKTSGHELGHGVFGLEHPFKRHTGLDEFATNNLMSWHPTATKLCKYQWDLIQHPVCWIDGSCGSGENALMVDENRDLKARYIMTIYSPYISHQIKDALENYSDNEKPERIKELLSHIFTKAGFSDKNRTWIRQGLNKGIPLMNSKYKRFLPQKTNFPVAKLLVSNEDNKYGIVFYLVTGTPKFDSENKIIEIYSPFIIERMEYFIVKTKMIEDILPISNNEYLVSKFIFAPFSLMSFKAKWYDAVVTGGFTIEAKAGFMAGLGAKYSFALAADPKGNFAFIGSEAAFITGLFSLVGDKDEFTSGYSGWDIGVSFDLGTYNLNHVYGLHDKIPTADFDFPVLMDISGQPNLIDLFTKKDIIGSTLSAGFGSSLGYGEFLTKTSVYAFSLDDVIYFARRFKEFTERIIELKSNNSDYYIKVDLLKEGNIHKFVFILYIFNDAPSFENSLEQFRKGKFDFSSIQNEIFILLEYEKKENTYFETPNVIK